MAGDRAPPVKYVRDLIPHIIDKRALTEPNKIFAEIPNSATDVNAGWKIVTYAQLANAINGTARWLEKHMGRGRHFETLAYVGSSDLRYPILAVAMMKVGFKVLFTSPRNSIQGHADLFNATQTATLITSQPPLPMVDAFLRKHPMHTLFLPALDELLNAEPSLCDYGKSFEEGLNDPFLVLHTSGSTGSPKPIVVTNGFFDTFMASTAFIEDSGSFGVKQVFANRRIFNGLPMFHGAGIAIGLIDALYLNAISILPPPGQPPTADGTINGILRSGANMAFLASFILEGISKSSELLDKLGQLEYVVYGGAALPQPVGDIIKTKTWPLNVIGGTEFMSLQTVVVDRDDWNYIEPHPVAGLEFRQYTADLYEAVILRKPETERFQTVWHTLPHLKEYRTRDLYSKHPTKPGLWAHRGRADDVIVYVTGEKMNPVNAESTIATHSDVQAALIAGTGRFQSTLLIEPAESTSMSKQEKAEFIERVWPVVEKANRDCPAHGKILRSHILFTEPDKPMHRAAKGSVQRAKTIASYANELDTLYRDADMLEDMSEVSRIDWSTKDSLCATLHDAIRSVMSATRLDLDRDFFSTGMDSLQVLQITRMIKASLGTSNTKDAIAPSMLYTRPTVFKLAETLMALKNKGHMDQTANDEARATEMKQFLEQYSTGLPSAHLPVQTSAKATSHIVILTGSTGNLGKHLLRDLILRADVGKIYCLDRSLDAEKRHRDSLFFGRELPGALTDQRVRFLHCDLTHPRLGIDDALYLDLAQSATLIIHNAWTVDFNQSLSSFAPVHLSGMINLLKLAATTAHRAHFFFVSSVSTILNLQSAKAPTSISEDSVTDPLAAQPAGYAESKWVAEQLLTRCSAVASTICRVGQVAGPVYYDSTKSAEVRVLGKWPEREWLPSLVLSSAHLGALPSSLGALETVAWVPVDVLSPALLEMALGRDGVDGELDRSCRVLHAVNPRRTSWKDLLPSVKQSLKLHGPGQHKEAIGTLDGSTVKDPEIVDYAAWIARLRSSVSDEESSADLQKNPAVKLLDFFEGAVERPAAPLLDTRMAEKASETLRALDAVKTEWMDTWIAEWMGSTA